MRFSILASFAAALATTGVLAAVLKKTYEINGFTVYGNNYQDPAHVKCDSSVSHCIYMKNARSYGSPDGIMNRCAQVKDGFGYDVCQYPKGASVTVGCTNDFGKSGVSVTFGGGTKISPAQYTTFGDRAHAIFSSERAKTHSIDGRWTESTESGDDLYVECEPYQLCSTQN